MDASAQQQKRTLYVGGLEDDVDEKTLHAAFIPFGDIVEVQIPTAPGARGESKKKHRGFGFVVFEEMEDAAAAMDNMDDAELFGRVLRVTLAKPMKGKLGGSKAIWEQSEEWLKQLPADADAAPQVPSLQPSAQPSA